ncbi:MAG: TSUP family transporter [Bacillota bacterium]|jgi:uncharacterized membrane protein YfcA
MLGTILLRLVVIGAGVNAVSWCIVFYRKLFKNRSLMLQNPNYQGKGALLTTIQGIIIGVTMFFDTLGIGGNAPQTALFKMTKAVPDRLIPGTLNTCTLVGSATETMLFVSMVSVDPLTLVCFIGAVTIGARIGAKYVSHFPLKPIRIILGFGLIVVAGTMILRQFGLWVPGGLEIGIYGWKLIVATILAFIVGLLAAAGIGGYAFMIAICYGLGMDPRSAFPIMFGSYTFLMLASGLRFLKEDALDYRANAIGVITGTVGVLLAFFIVKSMPLEILFWLVIAIVLYTAIMMLIAGFRKPKPEEEAVEVQAAE